MLVPKVILRAVGVTHIGYNAPNVSAPIKGVGSAAQGVLRTAAAECQSMSFGCVDIGRDALSYTQASTGTEAKEVTQVQRLLRSTSIIVRGSVQMRPLPRGSLSGVKVDEVFKWR